MSGEPNNGGDDLTDTIFDDEAATTIGSGASTAPYTGNFRPQGDQLARFDGKEQQGTWKLRAERPLRERHRLAARLGADHGTPSATPT